MEIATTSLLAEFGLHAIFFGVGIFAAYFVGMQYS
jgi:hypothetical protein